MRPTFEAAILIAVRVGDGGWLMDSKEAFVLFKKEIVPQRIEDSR